jgi:hypothetical protein
VRCNRRGGHFVLQGDRSEEQDGYDDYPCEERDHGDHNANQPFRAKGPERVRKAIAPASNISVVHAV